MSAKKVLIVDDEPGMRRVLLQSLMEAGYDPVAVESAEDALDVIENDPPLVVIADYNLPEMDGLTMLRTIKASHPQIVVLVITAYADMDTSIEALRAGAYDFLPKPFKPDILTAAVDRAFEKIDLTREVKTLSRRLSLPGGFDAIVGESPALLKVIEKAKRIAPTDDAVLITGESGTGKEMFASAIHQISARAQEKFMVINCSAIPEHLLESELFGHRKGAFTGAFADRVGLLQGASGGTVFFDEIGDISPSVQVTLLRFLQDHKIRRVGDTDETEVDVRIIVATNKDLEKEIEEGRFRSDLFYRLRVLELSLPALRERKEDIPLLIDYFAQDCVHGMCRGSACFSPETLAALSDYPWPGNVRELENLLKQLTVLCLGGGISLGDLPSYVVTGEVGSDDRSRRTIGIDYGLSYSEMRARVLADFNRTVIRSALDESDGNITRAAERLRTPKSNLLRLMKKYGIDSPSQTS